MGIRWNHPGPPIIRDNGGMQERCEDPVADAGAIQIQIEDEHELTPKELAQERKAALEAHERLNWLRHTPEQLAGRIPVSVFAMGDLASGR